MKVLAAYIQVNNVQGGTIHQARRDAFRFGRTDTTAYRLGKHKAEMLCDKDSILYRLELIKQKPSLAEVNIPINSFANQKRQQVMDYINGLVDGGIRY